MNALPTTFTEWLGGDSFLLEICPARENRGAEVQRIQELSPEALTEGRRIACGASLELVRGGLLYALDALSAAHEIFQRDSTALGSYWHGMMHRREGDFGNACYWFRAAGRSGRSLIPSSSRCAARGMVGQMRVCWRTSVGSGTR
jgi:hypothetical protein